MQHIGLLSKQEGDLKFTDSQWSSHGASGKYEKKKKSLFRRVKRR